MRAARPLLALALVACETAAPAPARDGGDDLAAPPRDTADTADIADTADTAATDADADTTATDAAAEPSADVPADVTTESPPSCADPDAAELLRALRAPPREGVSVVAAPGLAFEDLRPRIAADPAAMTLLAQARSSVRRTVPALAVGDSATYQTVASLALAAAFVAWHDRDAAAQRTALQALAAATVDAAWLSRAREVPIFVGASLVDLAAAVDLLAATAVAPADLAAAREGLGRTLDAVEAWIQAGGEIFLRFHEDNHGVRLSAGVLAAGMVVPASELRDAVMAFALAHLAASIERQSGGTAGWAEGSTYLAYAFEVGVPALLAVDRAWTGGDARCVRCPTHRLSACALAPQRVVRPSRDPRVRDTLRWAAALESRGGWLQPIDDSRLMAAPAPLFERLLGARAFSHWSPTGPLGSTGGSVAVGPLVALALAAPALSAQLPRSPTWPAAGTARLDGATPAGLPLEAFLIAEDGPARDGAGHERPDVLAVQLAVGGTLVLGGSGYRDYASRAPLARADAASVITVEPDFPASTPAGESGPAATLAAEGASARFTLPAITVSRTLTLDAGALVVSDRIEVSGAPRELTWHWHLRGAADPERWQWTVGSRRCEATQRGDVPPVVRAVAPHFDDYSRMESHAVVRQTARLPPGRHELVTRIACDG